MPLLVELMLSLATVSNHLITSFLNELADWYGRNSNQDKRNEEYFHNLQRELTSKQPLTIPYDQLFPLVQGANIKRHSDLVNEASQWVKQLDITGTTLLLMTLLYQNEEGLKKRYLKLMYSYFRCRQGQNEMDVDDFFKRMATLPQKLKEMRQLRLPSVKFCPWQSKLYAN